MHRDIKPDNLFVTRDPDDPARRVPKVLDFGISKVAADSPLVEGTLTATGATLGTPHYMSTRAICRARTSIARTDVYAFGVVLYECLTGKRPFESDNFSAIVREGRDGDAGASERAAAGVAARARRRGAEGDGACA